MCMDVFPNSMYVYRMHTWSEEAIGSLVAGVSHGCEQPCASWELNEDPLQEQIF